MSRGPAGGAVRATSEALDALVRGLGLAPHPEGGFYRETYRAELLVEGSPRHGGRRAASTAIYYLLRDGDFSALHRIASDEVWHHYAGAPLTVHVLRPDGHHQAFVLGTDLARGERPQAVVPGGCWFGARIEAAGAAPEAGAGAVPGDGPGFALVGCTVAPGFDFADFELGARAALLADYPQHAELVRALTREG